MATNNSSSVQTIRHPASTFRVLNPPEGPSLFARVNWVFILYIGCLAAGTAYCLSNLYQAYQLKFNNSFGLDNQFKLIQCHALLDEAQEKEKKQENGEALLFQRCEVLIDSVDNDDFTSMALHKDKLLLQLAHQYVKNDPNHSYQIAQKITSFYDLFKAAQSIQKEHLDLNQLNVLYTQAFDAMTKEW
ncbi:MAG TPA: hypothetical protein VHK67_05855, partial [Rhabdochlamydiaceae bacterium]|nr:hypothetical protein [Rhabdochlamydiaceae bacterium]